MNFKFLIGLALLACFHHATAHETALPSDSLKLNLPAKADEMMESADSMALSPVDLTEVTVQASRNQSRLIDLPSSATVLQTNQIEKNDIRSLKEAASLIPNMVMPDYGSRLTSPIYIRGVGSRINAPSVGLYVDNVPYFEKSAFDFDFIDIEKVEVLRGPQGTLYGRNSMGGVINVITRSPMQYQGTQLFCSAAGYGTIQVKAGHYAKPTESFAWSLSANYRHTDGFFENAFDGSRIDHSNSYGLNSRLIYAVSRQLSLEYSAGLDISRQGGYPYALYDPTLQKTASINYNQASSYDRTLFSNALKLIYEGENWELLNTVSGQYLDDVQRIDQDFTPDSLYFVNQMQLQHMLADECTVRSKGNRRLNWLAGTFVFTHRLGSDVDVDTYQSQFNYLKGYQQNISGLAIFGQAIFNVTKQFAVTAGLRFDEESSNLHYSYEGTRKGKPLTAIDTVYPGLREVNLLPKLALSYKLDKHLLYASYATGYKPGGFNSTFEKPEQLQFRSETSHNFEAGAKGNFFRDRLFMDVSLFYTQLLNQQIYRTAPSGKGSYLDNAGLSVNKGFECSLSSQPWKGMEASVAYGFTDSRIMRYVKDTLTNYNGKFTPYIPASTLSVQLNQTVPVKGLPYLDKIRLNLLYQRTGQQYWDLVNAYREKAYGLVNAKLSFIRKNVKVEFWGKNLFNTSYKSFLFEALNKTYAQVGKPFQAGMNLSLEW